MHMHMHTHTHTNTHMQTHTHQSVSCWEKVSFKCCLKEAADWQNLLCIRWSKAHLFGKADQEPLYLSEWTELQQSLYPDEWTRWVNGTAAVSDPPFWLGSILFLWPPPTPSSSLALPPLQNRMQETPQDKRLTTHKATCILSLCWITVWITTLNVTNACTGKIMIWTNLEGLECGMSEAGWNESNHIIIKNVKATLTNTQQKQRHLLQIQTVHWKCKHTWQKQPLTAF